MNEEGKLSIVKENLEHVQVEFKASFPQDIYTLIFSTNGLSTNLKPFSADLNSTACLSGETRDKIKTPHDDNSLKINAKRMEIILC